MTDVGETGGGRGIERAEMLERARALAAHLGSEALKQMIDTLSPREARVFGQAIALMGQFLPNDSGEEVTIIDADATLSPQYEVVEAVTPRTSEAIMDRKSFLKNLAMEHGWPSGVQDIADAESIIDSHYPGGDVGVAKEISKVLQWSNTRMKHALRLVRAFRSAQKGIGTTVAPSVESMTQIEPTSAVEEVAGDDEETVHVADIERQRWLSKDAEPIVSDAARWFSLTVEEKNALWKRIHRGENGEHTNAGMNRALIGPLLYACEVLQRALVREADIVSRHEDEVGFTVLRRMIATAGNQLPDDLDSIQSELGEEVDAEREVIEALRLLTHEAREERWSNR